VVHAYLAVFQRPRRRMVEMVAKWTTQSEGVDEDREAIAKQVR
jgi:hypothetical protein